MVQSAVYDIIVPVAAAQGSFVNGIDNRILSNTEEKSDFHDELYLVVGKSQVSLTVEVEAKDTVIDSTVEVKDRVKKRHLDGEDLTLVCYNTVTKKVRQRISSVSNPRQCVASMGTLLGDRYIVVGSATSKITFWSESAQTGPQYKPLLGQITCLATQENTGLLVTGHEHGEIAVWHDLIAWIQASKGKGKAQSVDVAHPVCTTLHWHAHPVASLALSPDGRYMFSGGEEGVLVVWQLATGIKDFVPRLGAAITFLSASTKESRVAVTTGDNSIRIVNTASLKEDWEMRSLYVPMTKTSKKKDELKVQSHIRINKGEVFTQSDSKYRASIRVEGRSGCIALNGYPGQLQMLDLATQIFRTSHEVVQFTRVSKKEVYSQIIVPSTTHYQFLDTPIGALLVTVDVRRGEDSEAEGSLKFWEWDAQRSNYRLSAQVDRPHGSSRVTSVIFAPSSSDITQHGSSSSHACYCATSAMDGSIKIWVGQSRPVTTAVDKADKYKSSGFSTIGMHWSCSFSFKHRDCPAGAMSFSFDGSLLAVSYENVVTLWDPAHVMLRKSIVAPSRDNVIFTAFVEPRASPVMGGGAGEAMLVVGTKQSLSVYDLISMQLMWTTEGQFSSFAVASEEAAAILCESGSGSRDKVSDSKSFAWIAASAKAESGDCDGNVTEGRYKIVLFSCYSSEPLYVQRVRSRVTSMTFWSNQRDLTSSLSSGVVALTEQAEIFMVATVEALKQHFSERSNPHSNAVQAKVFGQKLPALPFTAVVNSYSQSSSSGANTIPESISGSLLRQKDDSGVNNGWLDEMFDSKSGNIPPLSTIYDDFMGGLLNKQQQQLESCGNDEGPTKENNDLNNFTADSMVVPVPSSGSSSKRLKSLDSQEGKKNDDTSLTFFSDSRSKVFAEGINSFFSEFIQSSVTNSTEDSHDIPKSSVKAKKSEKRKSGVLG
eukprot:CAMPEP_0119046284 /NCGR_PEP_ID=MMETSP1177-20130426/45607_1 /TAXON_ID=2985 /ORGANISM="Ochromonas sp, Strain CCMP1899" /LENGTH=937 /DNA_ID=CAMNT_0007019219 /DNA_START=394 /DNA_END=3207 /DNA_ORIENTATION=-